MQKGKRTLQKKIELTSWLVLAAMLCFSSILASFDFTLGILAGGVISILNFYGLSRGLQKAFGQWDKSRRLGKASLTFKYLLRLTATGIILYGVLVKTSANIFGIVIGLATVIIAVLLAVTTTFFDKSTLKEV